MMKKNSIFSKTFIVTLFWKQNKYHKHGVLMHTLKVFYYTLKNKDYKMLVASLLHDIGKPFVAYQKPEDLINNEYSFTDHEEMSYQIIKNWFFISKHTKLIVRYHYLIRDIEKSKIKNKIDRAKAKERIWNSLDKDMQEDLKRFIEYDDMGKK